MQHPPRPGSSACRDGCGRRSPPTRSVRHPRPVRVDSVVERLGGVCESWVLHRLTSRSRVRRALAAGQIVRDARGRYALPGADEAMRQANALSGILCLDSAARHHGWRLKHPPVLPAVAVPRKRKVARQRRDGVRLMYVDLLDAEVDGLATHPLRTVLDCASRLPFDEALAVADSALRCGDVDAEPLLRAAEGLPDRYRARGRRVARESSALAANPFESVLRAIALDVLGLHLEPQVVVAESPLLRPDLVDRERAGSCWRRTRTPGTAA